MDLFETLHTCCGHIEDVHVGFLVELELILTELQPFEVSHFWQFFALWVWSLCNQFLLQVSMDHFETMHTCCGYIKNVHVNFCRRKNNF